MIAGRVTCWQIMPGLMEWMPKNAKNYGVSIWKPENRWEMVIAQIMDMSQQMHQMNYVTHRENV